MKSIERNKNKFIKDNRINFNQLELLELNESKKEKKNLPILKQFQLNLIKLRREKKLNFSCIIFFSSTFLNEILLTKKEEIILLRFPMFKASGHCSVIV